MSAIVGTAVANVDLVKNVFEEITFTAATNAGTAVTDTETFYVTPAKPDGEGSIIINNNCGQTVTVTVLGGDFWYSASDMTPFTIATAKMYGGTVDTGAYLQSTGKIHVKVTPTNGTALTASDDVTITYLELRT